MLSLILRHGAFILAGFTIGLLYYHHIRLQTEILKRGSKSIFLSFWFRYSLLAVLLSTLFKIFPEGIPGTLLGLFVSRPLYFYKKRKWIYGVTDAG